jgi:hypothetical protein
VKGLIVVVLIFGTFASTVFARCGAEQALKDRRKVLFSWLGIVRAAENKHKTNTGRYGDLADLRKAHLLDALVFQSDSSTGGHSESEAFVPESSVFQVTASQDGQHFKAMIHETSDAGSIGVEANETGTGSTIGCPQAPLPIQDMPLRDGPEGPIITLPG